jgi:hypothetical protein
VVLAAPSRALPSDVWRSTGRRTPWTIAVSLAIHGLFLLALLLWTNSYPAEAPPVRSIDVQILSAPAPAARAPTRAPTPERATPQPDLAALPPNRVTPRKPSLPSQAIGASDGMTHPTQLLAGAYIRDPASVEIRRNLPKLAPSERVTQLCNIEAGQQIGAADPKILVDTVHASALGDTTVDGLTIAAPLAGYRTHRQWYGLSFVCTVAPDFKGVTDFKFKVGAAIPHELWQSHALNAADENE